MAAAMIVRRPPEELSLKERMADLESGVAALESVRRKRINVAEYVQSLCDVRERSLRVRIGLSCGG